MKKTAVVTLLALASCINSSTGKELDLSKISAGMTPDQVIEAVGKPNMRTSRDVGTEEWTYSWIRRYELHAVVIYFKDGKLADPPTAMPK